MKVTWNQRDRIRQNKVDKEVDSQVNRLSKNNKDAVKKQIQSIRTGKALSKEKRLFILGDSVIKHINGYEISGKLENCEVFVRPCHGTTIRCLKDHIKPVLRENLDEIIFRIGTNDLPSGKGNKDIAQAIINLAMSVKT